MNKRNKAFTLIELLVVVAIIGILSAVVLTNLNSSRQKARDTKRIADVKQLQLALTLYADVNNGKYPGALTSGTATDLAPTYTPSIPFPPAGVSGVTSYTYVPLDVNGGDCNGYHLGTALEVNSNKNLLDDVDASASIAVATNGTCGSAVPGGIADFSGTSPACTTASGVEACFDLTQ